MFTLNGILEATRGALLYKGDENGVFIGVSIDSRTIKKDEIFICIKGDKFDGHTFIRDAIDKGAKGVIISDDILIKNYIKKGVSFIKTDNTTKTLGDIAFYHRGRFSIPVIGITGSNGKTTTKEITSSILNRRFNTLKNTGNFNNQIGLPLTLFNLNSKYNAAVLELGTNTPGEIERLCEILRPTIGAVTNVSEAHMEGFGSIEAIREEKGALVRSMDKDGVSVLNADERFVSDMKGYATGRVVTYGIREQADISADDIKPIGMDRYSFMLKADKDIIPVNMPYAGLHNIYNSLCAAGVAYGLGIGIEDIKKGIESYVQPAMRMDITNRDGITIINDAYNANPRSTVSAIKTLLNMPEDGKKIFVFGDMRELGDISKSAHKDIGREVAKGGVDIFITVGVMAKFSAEEALRSGMDRNNVFPCDSTDDALETLCNMVAHNDYILVKGSRGMKMEKIVEGLKLGTKAQSGKIIK